MVKIILEPGNRYLYRTHPVRFKRLLDLTLALGEYEATGALVQIPVADLQPIEEPSENVLPFDDVLSVPTQAWAKAQRRLSILQPILAARGDSAVFIGVCEAHQLGKSTIYRWLKAYDEAGSVQALVELPRTGGKGKNRLDDARTAIIDEVIATHYLTRQKKTASEIVLEVRRLCRRAKLQLPADSTVRRRIHQLDQEETMRRRLGSKAARDRFRPQQGEYPDADYPLQVVQLDHTPVDIILVDEIFRQPLGRPYLTMAIDVYSRMVVGMYLSYDPPGTIGTGLCMAHMLLPKEQWLKKKVKVEGLWPCWGVPGALHLDNAREFRGEMMQRACEKYGIRLEYRPVKTPDYGGHIERLMGICMKKVHTLPGTTFSNPQQRGAYDSEKMAALTIREFEQWLTTYIVDVYHKRVHGKTHQIPYQCFEEGIMGTPDQPGTGQPERLYDEEQVRIDFLPSTRRTVQQKGVQIGYIYYYADVLSGYINRVEPGSGENGSKQLLTFKYDPRDISVLHLLEPGTNYYHRVPYRTTSRPSISVWEHRAAIRELRRQGMKKLDEDAIFDACDRMRDIELSAVARTKSMKKGIHRVLRSLTPEEVVLRLQTEPAPKVMPVEPQQLPAAIMPLSIEGLQAFDDSSLYEQ
ncbi:helix-turn-helix domain-containing protein [Hymenobacter ruricola]|uniref:DDE-type integrase/transposase/recombinase n=1 Tax=Hymenobacter ruricola TaxID=2791023 RepID=A0ABS0IBM5_9BACT|nr:Mu transposase C-terminal domain-containing protein [Hymenobacter ruricola]MBF9223874.1 DDE-type integrase/transposase/recombinase [Hymenobacter ruricola]